MRFFFEFVSCCGLPTPRAPEPALPPPEEEERSLVPATTAASSRGRKRRMGSGEWRPSLGPILEDNAASPRERQCPRKGAVASAGREVKKRSAASAAGAAKVRQRSYTDGYNGSVAMPTLMSSFSPTPFMF